MISSIEGDKGAQKTTLVLRVRYAPVKQPMVEPRIDGATTLAVVKAMALKHFGLTEEPLGGGSKTYQLSHDDVVQTDLSIPLEDLVDHGRQVELLLIEQFIQG